MKSKIVSSFLKLKTYCELENFMGWDPYDGLNSRLFQCSPLKHWDLARLAWIQAFKRSPINFRKLLLVPKQHNAKGIGLFLSGYCNLYYLASKGETAFGTEKEILFKINELANLLDSLRNTNFSGACWGYNFPWQARRLFLFPKDTPTVVATSFCVEALFKAYEITKNEYFKHLALSSADFIMNDLNRTPTDIGVSSLTFPESVSASSTIATLSAVDSDTSDTHVFSLINGNGSNDADNSSFTVSGTSLIINSTADFETKASYNIYLNVYDGANNFAKAFTVSVTNVNEAPSDIFLLEVDTNNLVLYLNAKNTDS